MYVADTGNHKIRILNNDLTVNVNQPPFGTEGDGEQQFMEPHDISFVEEGNIVTMCVVDHGNNRIQVFTANNDIIQYSMTIRARGGGGGVAQRTSIAADLQCVVYVSENGKDCVSKYSIDGNFIGLFGPLPFRNPHAIAVDDTGTVYVCDTGNDRVQRFEA